MSSKQLSQITKFASYPNWLARHQKIAARASTIERARLLELKKRNISTFSSLQPRNDPLKTWLNELQAEDVATCKRADPDNATRCRLSRETHHAIKHDQKNEKIPAAVITAELMNWRRISSHVLVAGWGKKPMLRQILFGTWRIIFVTWTPIFRARTSNCPFSSVSKPFFDNQIRVGKLLTRSTVSTFFSRPQFVKFYM